MFSHTSPFSTLPLFTQPPPGVDDDFASGSRRGRTAWCNNEVCVLDLIISMFQQPHNESPSSQDLLLDQDGTACAGAAEQEPQCHGGQYFQGVNINDFFLNFKCILFLNEVFS